MSVYCNRSFEQSQIPKPRGCRTAVGTAPRELAAPAQHGAAAAGAAGTERKGAPTPREAARGAAHSSALKGGGAGSRVPRYSASASIGHYSRAGARGDRAGAISPVGKGTQPQQATASDCLCTRFPSQPTAEPLPKPGVPSHPRRAAAAGQLTFLTHGAIAAGQESSVYLLFC